MADLDLRRTSSDPRMLIRRSAVSFICACFAQFSLYLICYIFPSSNILTLLFLSVIVLLAMAGIGRGCKRLLGLRGSAPAFMYTNLLFIWCVYLVVIRKAVSSSLDIVFNAEIIMLLIGLYRIQASDPGFVNCGPLGYEKLCPLSNVEDYSEVLEPSMYEMDRGCPSNESSLLQRRVRYCKHCHAHVKGFDHHCPAFGNCIGQNNHVLFIVLVAGFIIAETCYIEGASKIATGSHIHNAGRKETGWAEVLATSTVVFSLLQVLWQAVFLTWHIYCVCFNIRTDEWIHWKKYPEFQQIVHPQPGQTVSETKTRFTNPYDKGIFWNIKEFIEGNG